MFIFKFQNISTLIKDDGLKEKHKVFSNLWISWQIFMHKKTLYIKHYTLENKNVTNIKKIVRFTFYSSKLSVNLIS